MTPEFLTGSLVDVDASTAKAMSRANLTMERMLQLPPYSLVESKVNSSLGHMYFDFNISDSCDDNCFGQYQAKVRNGTFNQRVENGDCIKTYCRFTRDA